MEPRSKLSNSCETKVIGFSIILAVLCTTSLSSAGESGSSYSRYNLSEERTIEILNHPELKEKIYPQLEYKAQEIHFSVHSSKFWDRRGITRPAIEKIIDHLRSKEIKTILLESRDPEDWRKILERSPQYRFYFPTGFNLHNITEFDGLFHRFQISARRIIVTGGRFHECLCRFIHSTILQAPGGNPIKIFFITDGIYSPVPNEWINIAGEWLPGSTRSGLLSERIDSIVANNPLNWEVFLGRELSDYFVGPSNRCSEFMKSNQNFNIKILIDDKNIQLPEQSSGREIQLIFMTTDQFIADQNHDK